MTYRLTYEKYGRMRFIGHLDLIRIFQRAVKRAEIPVAYSQGFNPHQLMSFALPLPLGMPGYGESVEIRLTAPISNIADVLNPELPEGIAVIGARMLSAGEKTAASLVKAARYEIISRGANIDFTSAIGGVLASNEIIVFKKTKSKSGDTDIRPDIYDLSLRMENGVTIIDALLAAGSGRYLKPQVLMDYLASGEAAEADYKRMELLRANGRRLERLW